MSDVLTLLVADPLFWLRCCGQRQVFTALNRDLDTSISPSYQRRIGPKVNCSAGLRNHLLLVSIDIYGNFLGTERGASHILDAATV